MTVLVLGSTGSTGRRVTQQLRNRGVEVRAASRHGETLFDWERPETWGPALDGISAVYVMAPDGVPVEPDLIAAAAAKGVERLVLLSTMHAEEIGDDRLLAAERLVREYGATWTVVRAHWFNQNFDEGFLRPAILAGELVIPLADQRQALVDADDIAAVAVEALTGPDHHAQTYEVTGPDALTFGEAVAIIATATGRPITYRGTPDDFLAIPDADPALLAYFTNPTLPRRRHPHQHRRTPDRPPTHPLHHLRHRHSRHRSVEPLTTPLGPRDPHHAHPLALGGQAPVPNIQFGNHPPFPLHSCLGTRRLSSVGRASHS
jgi:uncharacterized protein YbjT (DUF2867 family)